MLAYARDSTPRSRPGSGEGQIISRRFEELAAEATRVRSLTVVDALGAVIRWHREGLLPDAAVLNADGRTRLVEGDFFALMCGDETFVDAVPDRFHAILLDIDHTPRHLLHPSHAAFYTADRLRELRRHLAPSGVFALWSDDPPDADFQAALEERFATATAEVVTFPNPLTRGESTATVYVATT